MNDKSLETVYLVRHDQFFFENYQGIPGRTSPDEKDDNLEGSYQEYFSGSGLFDRDGCIPLSREQLNHLEDLHLGNKREQFDKYLEHYSRTKTNISPEGRVFEVMKREVPNL